MKKVLTVDETYEEKDQWKRKKSTNVTSCGTPSSCKQQIEKAFACASKALPNSLTKETTRDQAICVFIVS